MVKQGLIGEFDFESQNTRKLLEAIPDDVLAWKPAEQCWTTAELASHIVNIYAWYDGTINQDVFDINTFVYERGDISSMKSIREKFEINVANARLVLENCNEAALFGDWSFVEGGQVIIPPMKRIMAVRSFLMSHLYHHRGEMIVYLRSTGNKVPGLYGPVREDMPL